MSKSVRWWVELELVPGFGMSKSQNPRTGLGAGATSFTFERYSDGRRTPSRYYEYADEPNETETGERNAAATRRQLDATHISQTRHYARIHSTPTLFGQADFFGSKEPGRFRVQAIDGPFDRSSRRERAETGYLAEVAANPPLARKSGITGSLDCDEARFHRYRRCATRLVYYGPGASRRIRMIDFSRACNSLDPVWPRIGFRVVDYVVWPT